MHLIQRSIFWDTALRTCIIFAGVGSIVIATQILNQVNRIVDARENVVIVAEFFLNFVPTITVSILPFALLIAIVQIFDGMQEDNEVAVLSAAGARPAHMLMPFGLLAVIMSCVILLVSVFVEPVSNRRVTDLINSMKFNAIQIAAGSGALQEVQSDLYIRIANTGSDGRLERIFILDRRDPVTERAYYAKRGYILRVNELDVLRLNDGTIQYRNQTEGSTSQIIFDNYVVDMESLFSRSHSFGYRPRQTDTDKLIENIRSGDTSRRAREELVRRFSDWLYPLAFFSIAMFAIARGGFVRRRSPWRLSLCLAGAAVIKVCGLVLMGQSGNGVTAITLAISFPAFTMLLFSVLTISASAKNWPPRFFAGMKWVGQARA